MHVCMCILCMCVYGHVMCIVCAHASVYASHYVCGYMHACVCVYRIMGIMCMCTCRGIHDMSVCVHVYCVDVCMCMCSSCDVYRMRCVDRSDQVQLD